MSYLLLRLGILMIQF